MQAYYYEGKDGAQVVVKPIPDELLDKAQEYHDKLVEQICDLDEELMLVYLEGEEPSVPELKSALRKGCCEGTAIPVCCGNASRQMRHRSQRWRSRS